MGLSRYPYFENPFQSVEEVKTALELFETRCLEKGDLRGVFATAYLQITHAISNEIKKESFNDNKWSANYLVRFANLYREALLNYESNTSRQVPKSWKVAFDLAKNQEGFIIQHLTLGINAHINHDLALALNDVGINSNREEKYQDHIRINHILEQATDNLKQSVSEKYAPILKRLDRGLGTVDDKITVFSISKAREHAWAMAVALSSSRSAIEKSLLQSSLDEQAAVLSRLILSSPTRSTRLKSGIRKLKWVDRLITKIKSWFG
ncbi:MAG TPA: DUF5995 family protein [Balneolaceae bacterium]|nr:DUF5995 family protein [Balneolaceae bacterium]